MLRYQITSCLSLLPVPVKLSVTPAPTASLVANMQNMHVCPDYVPDPNTDTMPNDMAGENYTVYKLAQPRIVDLNSEAIGEYVRLIVTTLEEDKDKTQAVFELLQTLDDDGMDERVMIYSMAKLINTNHCFSGLLCTAAEIHD